MFAYCSNSFPTRRYIMSFEFIKSAATSVGNAAKSTGNFIWENKGKIIVAGAAIGAAVVYREEVSCFANSLIEKVSNVEVPTVEAPTVEV